MVPLQDWELIAYTKSLFPNKLIPEFELMEIWGWDQTAINTLWRGSEYTRPFIPLEQFRFGSQLLILDLCSKHDRRGLSTIEVMNGKDRRSSSGNYQVHQHLREGASCSDQQCQVSRIPLCLWFRGSMWRTQDIVFLESKMHYKEVMHSRIMREKT